MPLQPVNNTTVISSQYAFIGSPIAIISRGSITCDAGHHATFVGIVSQRDTWIYATLQIPFFPGVTIFTTSQAW